ncbi:MAG TPA: hypothetical protein P5572_05635 [Phycisphaerae bacterium]|nr:hypothetical protein [Phycisphaerae bacterium]
MLIRRLAPEIDRLPDARDRRELKVQALRLLSLTGLRGFVLGLLMCLPALVVAEAINAAVYRGWREPELFAVTYVVACIAAQAVWMYCHWGLARRRIREELRLRGLPTCTACGYDLTGNASGICPECGGLQPRG